jgi:anti-sigma B factor antagonist
MSNLTEAPCGGDIAPWWLQIDDQLPGTVRLRGELDLATVHVLRARLSRDAADLDVDCSQLTYIGVAGLRELLQAHRSRQARGATLRIVHPAPCVVRLLGLTGFDESFDMRAEHIRP